MTRLQSDPANVPVEALDLEVERPGSETSHSESDKSQSDSVSSMACREKSRKRTPSTRLSSHFVFSKCARKSRSSKINKSNQSIVKNPKLHNLSLQRTLQTLHQTPVSTGQNSSSPFLSGQVPPQHSVTQSTPIHPNLSVLNSMLANNSPNVPLNQPSGSSEIHSLPRSSTETVQNQESIELSTIPQNRVLVHIVNLNLEYSLLHEYNINLQEVLLLARGKPNLLIYRLADKLYTQEELFECNPQHPGISGKVLDPKRKKVIIGITLLIN